MSKGYDYHFSKGDTTNGHRGHGVIGTLMHCWCECKMNGLTSVENSLAIPQNIKHRITVWPNNATAGVYLREMETCSDKNWYMNLHSSITHNSRERKTNPVSINWWMDKQKVVYPYNGILFSYKKEWSTATWYNLDEPGTHYAQREKK